MYVYIYIYIYIYTWIARRVGHWCALGTTIPYPGLLEAPQAISLSTLRKILLGVQKSTIVIPNRTAK
jgi:hypothetical protein